MSTRRRINDASAPWRAGLAVVTSGLLLFLAVSGLAVYLLPFSALAQTSLLAHTLIGLVGIPVLLAYLLRHWQHRRGGNLSHYQLLGYLAVTAVVLCVISGLVLTWQGLFEDVMTRSWDLTHLISGLVVPVLIGVHLVNILMRRVNRPDARARLMAAQRIFWGGTVGICAAVGTLAVVWALIYSEPDLTRAFPDDYDWRFGSDRPFAPSLSRIATEAGEPDQILLGAITPVLREDQRARFVAALDQLEQEQIRHQHYAGEDAGIFTRFRTALEQIDPIDVQQSQAIDQVFEDTTRRLHEEGAIDPKALAGSERCGSCHQQIYEEWLPSAHRYSSMDDLFQVVQTIMADETSPAHTRYCAGCHDPISLFSGAKNAGNITLSAEGSHEGISCVSCHSITRADIQGNADYTLSAPVRYLYDLEESALAVLISDFLVRTYPDQHVASYARPLYKTAEYCAACHKQYMDVDLNTDIGRVQGQNQFDSWARSRWHVPEDPEQTVHCRECHMPLTVSNDPAAGDTHDSYRTSDDDMHRSHRFLGGNQYVPLLHDLEGAETHVRLTEQWLRGEIEIPEIAHKWTEGPVVKLAIEAPEQIGRGQTGRFRVVLTNNKTGHDFPTGPLDMIESWLEITVTDDTGRVLHHSGALDERDAVTDTLVWFKADAFDREGELIDRHNLWDLVGKSYARSLYPGVTDRVEVPLECPSVTLQREALEYALANTRHRADLNEPRRQATEVTLATGADDLTSEASRLDIDVVLWYRKANPDFLDLMYGPQVRAPVTEMNRARQSVAIIDNQPDADD